ncbi:nitrogen fixation protein NifU [freshwater metagenome]|uniref:Nitrogen fixation protein NifU n=1 Tax=freshwater metagenome TaxID=449393 RepID=A0A094PZI7_9ZZZZ
MQLDNLYQEVILDHYKRPQNKKLSLKYDAQVHHVNPSCGDEIDLNLTITDGTISNISWDGVGCSISQASVSILTDLLIGKKIAVSGDEAVLEDAIALAGVSKYPARIKCALLGWMAFKDASVQAQSKSKLD